MRRYRLFREIDGGASSREGTVLRLILGFAIYYAAVGQTDQTFEQLNAALEERESFLTRMDAEPYFWSYRTIRATLICLEVCD